MGDEFAPNWRRKRTREYEACSRCKAEKPAAAFRRTPSNTAASVCRACVTECSRLARLRDPERAARSRLASNARKRFGITLDEYESNIESFMRQQDGKCAVCGVPLAALPQRQRHLDHDHSTGRLRGMLCGPCNKGLGLFGDEPERLLAAAEYLERHQASR